MTCFDCKVCFGSKFTSSAEGRRFNWLIYDSMTSLFACGRFSKSRGLSASVSFLPSFPFPFPSFTHSIHRPVILCSRTAQKRLLRRLLLTFLSRSDFELSESLHESHTSLCKLVCHASSHSKLFNIVRFHIQSKKINDHPQIQIINCLCGLKWCLICSPVLCRGEIVGKCSGADVLCKFGLCVIKIWSNP